MIGKHHLLYKKRLQNMACLELEPETDLSLSGTVFFMSNLLAKAQVTQEI
jgi:hypothetical protein